LSVFDLSDLFQDTLFKLYLLAQPDICPTPPDKPFTMADHSAPIVNKCAKVNNNKQKSTKVFIAFY